MQYLTFIGACCCRNFGQISCFKEDLLFFRGHWPKEDVAVIGRLEMKIDHKSSALTNRSKNLNRRIDFILLSTIAFLLTLLYLFTQPLWQDRAVRWDGYVYVSMALQFVEGHTPQAEAPFIYRIGFSFMAAIISPQNPADAMQWISVISGFLSVLLMWLWLSNFSMARHIRIGMVLTFALQYHGPLRFGIFFPTLTYSLFWVMLLLGLLVIRWTLTKQLVHTRHLVLVFVVCLAGTLVRETMVIAPLAMVLFRDKCNQPSENQCLKVLGTGFTAFVCGMILSRTLSTTTGDYSFFETAITLLNEKTLLSLLAAIFLTFGPMIAVLAASSRKTFEVFTSNRDLLFLVVISMVLAAVGGTNTEMFLYWASPAVLAVIGIILTGYKTILSKICLLLPLVLAQLLAERVFWNFPLMIESVDRSQVIFTPLGNASYLDLWSHFTTEEVLKRIVITNISFALVYICVYLIFKSKSIKPRINSSISDV
jgi:hypothetical protein